MSRRKVLLQWIGHSDLRAMAASLTASKQQQLLAKLGGTLPRAGDLGPTQTLLTTQTFDEIRLLSNYPAEWGKWFVAWLGVKADLVQVALDKPTDYAAIYRIANGELGKIRDRDTWSETELCLHLSPGTPAMAAVWLLLGKTSYPATLTVRRGRCKDYAASALAGRHPDLSEAPCGAAPGVCSPNVLGLAFYPNRYHRIADDRRIASRLLQG